jgi:nitroreductase
MAILDLTVDEVLSTTRAVRKRLDLTRPVEREVLVECLELALQAPTASNTQPWHFVVVTDPATRAQLADCYRTGWADYSDSDPFEEKPGESKLGQSSRHLARHLQDVPVHVIPCLKGRLEGSSHEHVCAMLGSVLQGAWSFQLAARSRGLGTVWTTLHLPRERDAAAILGLPYEEVTQVGLIPVAYTLGTDFKPAARKPFDEVIHWERW